MYDLPEFFTTKFAQGIFPCFLLTKLWKLVLSLLPFFEQQALIDVNVALNIKHLAFLRLVLRVSFI